MWPIIDILSFYEEEGCLWSELVGQHVITKKYHSLTVGDLYVLHRHIKVMQPLPTDEERIVHVSKQALDRHLKRLIKAGVVEKTLETSGKKGRPSGRYKLVKSLLENARYQNPWVSNVQRPGEEKR